MTPHVPIALPCIHAPWACAASSSRVSPFSLHQAAMWSISQGSPQLCIVTTARVRGVSLRFASSRSKQAVFGSISIKIGTSPKNRIARHVEKNVYDGTMISLPGGRSSAKYMEVSALEPFMCAFTKGDLVYSFHSFSNFGNAS